MILMKNNKELLEELKFNIAATRFEEKNRKYQNIPKSNEIDLKCFMKKKIIVGLCTGCLLISGVAVATNLDKIEVRFGLGKGIDKAVQNGYIAEPEMDYVESNSQIIDDNKEENLENIDVSTKVDNFLMDDLNISTHFTIEIDKVINETIDINDIRTVELKDLVVIDENNNILFCTNKETFNNYCKENGLDNINYYRCGLNYFIESRDKENGIINLVYNISTDTKSFPKSKKLKFQFSTISLKRNDYIENEDSIVNIKGNWTMEFDVPEEMYNRQTISYRVISCEESDFEITNATLTNTGFELGIIISNIGEQPEEPQIIKDLRKQQNDGVIDNNEYNRIINYEPEYREALKEWNKSMNPITIEELKFAGEEGNSKVVGEDVTYVENEKGEKFGCSMRPGRRQDNNFIDGGKFSFYETFELTSYDATDKLKVRIVYKDEPVIIELEKMK